MDMPAQVPPDAAAPAPSAFTPPADVRSASTSPSMAMDLIAGVLNSQPMPQQPMPQQPVSPDGFAARFAVPSPDNPAETPIPEVPPEQQVRLPEGAPDNVGHAFAAARAETRRYRQLAEDMRRQLEAERAERDTFSKKEADLARQLTDAQRKYSELEDKLGRIDLTQSKDFQDKYDVPLQAVQDDIAKALVDNGIRSGDAESLAREIMLADDPTSMMSELPAVTQGMIMYKLREANGLWAGREQALNEWRSTQAGLAEVSSRDGAVVNSQRRAELADVAFERIRPKAPTLQWDDPDYNPRRDAAIEKAKAWYQQAPDDQVAAAAMEGFMAPFAYEVIDNLAAKVRDLQDQLAGRRQLASPPVSPYFGGSSYPAPPKRDPPPERVPWTPVDRTGDMNSAAMGYIGALLARK